MSISMLSRLKTQPCRETNNPQNVLKFFNLNRWLLLEKATTDKNQIINWTRVIILFFIFFLISILIKKLEQPPIYKGHISRWQNEGLVLSIYSASIIGIKGRHQWTNKILVGISIYVHMNAKINNKECHKSVWN